MSRLLPFIFLIVAILLLVCIPLTRLDTYRGKIANQLSERLGHKVAIGKLEPVFFPPGLRLRDVAVTADASADTPLLQADSIEVALNLAALIKATIAPDSIQFKGWSAVVHRRRDGSWAWDEWISPTAQISEKAGWPVRTISFGRGEGKGIDPFGPGPSEFVVDVMQGSWEASRQYISINGEFKSLPTPVSFLFQASGAFAPQGQGNWSGVLTLNDESRSLKLDVKSAGQEVKLDSQSTAWRFDTAYSFLRYYARLPIPVPTSAPSSLLQNWESHANWQDGSLNFNHTASVAGGQLQAKGSVTRGSGYPTAKLDFGIQKAKAQPLESALTGSSPLDGTVTGLAHLEMTLSTAAWSTLSGQGAVEIADGRYSFPGSATQGMAKARTMKYLQKKYPNILTSGLAVSKASVHWQARGGTISFDDAFVDLGEIRTAATGSYDAERNGLDAYVRVQITERNHDLLKELPPSYMTAPIAENPKILPMHAKLQGSPGDWRIRVIRPSKVPGGVMNKLTRTIKK